MKKGHEYYKLLGAALILDMLWDGSFYRMGSEASKRIEKEMIYFFGKNWATDMYRLIRHDQKELKRLKELP